MEGFGEKSYENLIEAAKTASHTTLPRLIFGLGIAGIGLANAKVICRHFDFDLDAMREGRRRGTVRHRRNRRRALRMPG
mgnify:CR=1 FL=1